MDVKKILVAVDFSATSGRALDLARTLADALGASLHLITVVASAFETPADIEQEQRDACMRLEALLDPTDRTKRHATVSCQVGTPAHEIARYAADHEVDLIVMGTHTHGPTHRMATGSIAESVLGTAPCAVLAIKSGKAEPYANDLDPLLARAGL